MTYTQPSASAFPTAPGEAAPAAPHRPTDRTPEAAGSGRVPLRWLLPIRAGQVIVWEVAALVVVAALGHGAVTGIVVDALAGVAFVLTSIRIGGLSLAHWAAVGGRFRRRRAAAHRTAQRDGHAGDGGPTDDVGDGDDVAALPAMVPGLAIRGHVDRAGNRVGLASTGDGWSAIVRLAPETTPEAAALLAVARAATDRSKIPVAAVELVVWAVSTPETKRRYDRPERPVGLRIYWLALRYRPSDAPQAALARGGGETGAIRAAASAALGLSGALTGAGFPNTVLDEHELRQELGVAIGAEPPADPWEALPRRESWHGWSIGTARQVCFAVRGRRNSLRPMGIWLPEATFTCTSHTLRRTARGMVGETIVRIGIPPHLGGRPGADVLGRELLPLSGRQHQAVRRSLPLALD